MGRSDPASAQPGGATLTRPILENPDCSHVALLREMTARLEAIGGPMAEVALSRLAASVEEHINTVQIVTDLIESVERFRRLNA